jgi:hypothetical protein
MPLTKEGRLPVRKVTSQSNGEVSRATIALAIVFLKTAKRDLAGSLLTIGVAIVLGLASALPMPRRERAQAGSAD